MPLAFRASSSFRIRWITARGPTTPTWTPTSACSAGDLAQAAIVEAIFVYNTAMRDQMLPRKPLPHPELDEQRSKPLLHLMPGALDDADKDEKPAEKK